jgi:hypothetical protein
MPLSLTCKDCGETKPIEAFEQLQSGGRRGTCIACRRAAVAARKRALRLAYEASPEYQAINAQRLREKEERAAKKEADKAATAEAKAILLAERAAQREAARLERTEREAALRDDLWSAMNRGRSRRALQAVKGHPHGVHRIRVRDRNGYISIAELACRHAEREACARAARSCNTFETVAAAVAILEQATPTVQRTREMSRAWRTSQARSPFDAMKRTLGELDDDDDDADGFANAFGDWAPGWMQSMPLAA